MKQRDDTPGRRPAQGARRWPGYRRRVLLRAVGREDGAVTFLALGLTMLMVVVSLIAVNATMIVTARVSVQRAADAATLAACQDLPDTSAATTTATTYAASSGGFNATTATNLESGKGTQTATVAFSNDTKGILNSGVRVTVSRTQPLLGVPSVGFGDQTITATAKCARQEGVAPGFMALKPSGTKTFNISGGTQLDVRPAAVQSCSTDPDGMEASGSTKLIASHVYTGDGQATVTGGASITPAPVKRTTCTTPFDNVTEPALAVPFPANASQPSPTPGCPSTSPINPVTCVVDGATLTDAYPGYYWGGLELGNSSATTRRTITLHCPTQPCIYTLAGGGLTVHQNTTVVNDGDGVTIYNTGYFVAACTNKAVCNPTYSSKTVNCVDWNFDSISAGNASKQAILSIQPPTTGSYAYLLLWQGRSSANGTGTYTCTAKLDLSATVVTIGITNGATGGIYLPDGVYNSSGGTILTLHASVFANIINMSGGSSVTPANLPSGSVEGGAVRLVE